MLCMRVCLLFCSSHGSQMLVALLLQPPWNTPSAPWPSLARSQGQATVSSLVARTIWHHRFSACTLKMSPAGRPSPRAGLRACLASQDIVPTSCVPVTRHVLLSHMSSIPCTLVFLPEALPVVSIVILQRDGIVRHGGLVLLRLDLHFSHAIPLLLVRYLIVLYLLPPFFFTIYILGPPLLVELHLPGLLCLAPQQLLATGVAVEPVRI
mmetsp:Transcript_2118/g.3102  ORF Transcript_2118/g.3102 Transcript_2118/m.3102 type:complete len:209 (-) Transcript_2118:364-990(-)